MTNATHNRIRALRTEAGQSGDLDQVALCDRALAGDDVALAECLRVLTNGEAAHWEEEA